MYCGSLSEFLNDDDGYNSDDMYGHCHCRFSLGDAAVISIFPSPPLSPCEEKLNITTEMVGKCSYDEWIARRLTEAVVACGCQMCANASGPLINDCMWSAGAPVPAATSCPDSSSTFIRSQMLDLETSSGLVKTEVAEAKPDILVDVPSVCARLAEYRQTGSVKHSTGEKTTRSSKIVAAGCHHEITGEYDYWSQSGEPNVTGVNCAEESLRHL